MDSYIVKDQQNQQKFDIHNKWNVLQETTVRFLLPTISVMFPIACWDIFLEKHNVVVFTVVIAIKVA